MTPAVDPEAIRAERVWAIPRLIYFGDIMYHDHEVWDALPPRERLDYFLRAFLADGEQHG